MKAKNQMGKIVINSCFGGFGLSEAGYYAYAKHKGIQLYVWKDPRFSFSDGTYFDKMIEGNEPTKDDYDNHYVYANNIPRDDPALVAAVEELGSEVASDTYAKLMIVDIPKGTLYRIDEYDGLESIEYAEDVDWEIAT